MYWYRRTNHSTNAQQLHLKNWRRRKKYYLQDNYEHLLGQTGH